MTARCCAPRIKKVGVSTLGFASRIPRNDLRSANVFHFTRLLLARRSLGGGTVAAIRSPCVPRERAARRLVKVDIYEGANHRHRSSRLVNRLSAGAALR